MRSKVYGRVMLTALCVLAISLVAGTSEAQGVLFVEGNNVGVGIAAPATALHVEKADGTTKLLVREGSGTVAAREMFELSNNGGPFFIFKNTNISQSWSFAMGSTGNFNLSHQQTAGVQFVLTPTGNMTIAGSLTQGSSRAIKEGFEPVDSLEVLAAVTDMPLSMWSYKNDTSNARHLGPMAEDFYDAFSLGQDSMHIAPGDQAGVALAAIQGLNQIIENKNAEIEELRTRIETLESLIAVTAGTN